MFRKYGWTDESSETTIQQVDLEKSIFKIFLNQITSTVNNIIVSKMGPVWKYNEVSITHNMKRNILKIVGMNILPKCKFYIYILNIDINQISIMPICLYAK